MNGSLQTGIHFGLTSGVITTLGLMVGLHSSTHSLLAVVGGLLTNTIADAFSDTQGYRIPGGVRWSIMNILMVTNTFTPHVGGVARSVQGFASEFRKRGHRVLVLAPLFEGTPKKEQDVVRVPAVQHFSGSDFSVPMPVPGRVTAALRTFSPPDRPLPPSLLVSQTCRQAAPLRMKRRQPSGTLALVSGAYEVETPWCSEPVS